MDYAPMSPVGMLLGAGPVSRVVMIVLLAASVFTWVMILDGVYVLLRVSRARRALHEGGAPDVLWPILAAVQEAMETRLPGEAPKARRQRILSAARRATREFMSSARGGIGNLAIISSVGPFVGLFGTVWGIMSSFSGIAATQDTSLAIVAPGIAEALAATAYGLAAAIPAAIGYNRLGSAFARLGDELRLDMDRFCDAPSGFVTPDSVDAPLPARLPARLPASLPDGAAV